MPLNESINEVSIVNDSAVVLGTSLGEVLDTDVESDENNADDAVDEENADDAIDENNDDDAVDDNNNDKENVRERKTKKKPNIHRPCFYCSKMQSALTRHLSTKHKNEPAVSAALEMKPIERRKAFDKLKKEGIFKYNQIEMAKENPSYMRERENTDNTNLVICSKCKGCFSKKYKPRHQIECGKTSGQVMIPLIPLKDLNVTDLSDDFKAVLNKMIIDDVSSVAKTDPMILVIGARIFNGNKSKEEKICEVEKRVRQTMRLLSRLYIKFKESLDSPSVDSSDVFNKVNLKHLRFSIESLCEGDQSPKNGLKIQIQNTIKTAGKILEAHFLVECDDRRAEMVCEFLKIFGLVEDEIFNGALYQLKQKRNKTTRKPANLPDNSFVNDLKLYLKKITAKENFIFKASPDVFVSLRDATCARLTIFNGRRGGEPARLFVYQWQEALDGDWIRPEVKEAYKNEIKTRNRITFQEGKGDRQVPVFIPPDLVDAMLFLCSTNARNEASVAPSNKYVFPSTQQSEKHVEGWHTITNSCERAGLNGRINGTMNRHRVSSIIGSMDLNEKELDLAFDHFGHSKNINERIYQIPQAERQLASTGRLLNIIDENRCSTAAQSSSSYFSSEPSTAEIPKNPTMLSISSGSLGTSTSASSSCSIDNAKPATFSTSTEFATSASRSSDSSGWYFHKILLKTQFKSICEHCFLGNINEFGKKKISVI